MTSFQIKYFHEPNVLYLIWNPKGERRYKVGILTPEKFVYDVNGKSYKDAISKGFKGFPAFSLEKEEHLNPMPVFMRRCPPKERNDYIKYIEAYGMGGGIKNISDFGFLGYTGAHVPGNPFYLINPFVGIESPLDFVMQIAGVHHNYFKNNIGVDKQNLIDNILTLKPDPGHPKDKSAVKLLFKNEIFGYVPAPLTETFHKWLLANNKISIKICRFNGTEDHPYAYAYVEVI